MNFFILMTLTLGFMASNVFAQSIHIGPYLTNPSDSSMTIKWEGEHSKEMNFSYGPNVFLSEKWKKPLIRKIPALGVSSKRKLYSITLNGLKADTKYHYMIKDKDFQSQILSFKTFPSKIRNFSFLAMSDAQSGFKNTVKVVKDNVIYHAFEKNFQKEIFPLDFTLFAGDLVQNGGRYKEWKKHFFDPLAPLLKRIPVIPAIGNHEQDHRLYFSYFDFPKNGTQKYLEHWYYFDNSNVRFIGLDTNFKYRKKIQLNWLESVLKDAEKNSHIDFVIAFFHHPHESELWPIGNVNFSGKIKGLMESFSNRSNKPSVHLCGHTHGYSRGHSFKANHTMINVASIGGNLDEWGEYKQTDYPEYLISESNFGWVMAQVEVGENPRIRFKRYSHGDNHSLYDMGVTDEFVIKEHNKAPKKPVISKTKRTRKNIKVQSNSFIDMDKDGHLSTQIQIAKSKDFNKTILDKIYSYKNIYKEQNRSKGLNLEKITIEKKLRQRRKFYIRIRYRDKALAWSQWSDVKGL